MTDLLDPDARFDAGAVAATLIGARGADIADILNAHDARATAVIVERLPLDEAVKALDQPDIDDAEDIIARWR